MLDIADDGDVLVLTNDSGGEPFTPIVGDEFTILTAAGEVSGSCLFWTCEAGFCEETPIVYADMGGQNGACPADGTADANDRFHALNCFSNLATTGVAGYPCEVSPPQAFNVDAAGLAAPCTPDGVCDGNDAFAALNDLRRYQLHASHSAHAHGQAPSGGHRD